jgi:hypothetical protein
MEVGLSMLQGGADGAEVMNFLRSICTTNAGLSCTVSRIRTSLLANAPVPLHVVTTMTPYLLENGVEAFLALPLSEMIRVQREHKSTPLWTQNAEDALQSLHLVPSNLLELKLTDRELMSLKRTREGALITKQESLVHVDNAGKWLKYAIELARSSSMEMSFARLALPILLLTGRRTTEILNGKSTFTPTARPNTCLFKGAIKKRGASFAFEIPLLCDFAVVDHALRVLRMKQEGVELDAATCINRYHARLSRDELFPFVHNVHQLRGVYAAYVYHLFECDVTFNRAAMLMLGHEKLEVSLSYNTVKLHDINMPQGCYGPLPR